MGFQWQSDALIKRYLLDSLPPPVSHPPPQQQDISWVQGKDLYPRPVWVFLRNQKDLMLMRAFFWKWAHYCSFSSAFNLFYKCVSSWKVSKGISWICNKSKVKKKSLVLMKSIVMLQSWSWEFNYWIEKSRDGPQIRELSWGKKKWNCIKGETNKNWETTAIKFVKWGTWQLQIEYKFWICIISW